MVNRGKPPERILVIGATGQLGQELLEAMRTLGQVFGAARHPRAIPWGPRIHIDLERADAIRSAVGEVRPAIILNAAAYTAVDKAEEEPKLARTVNAMAPGILAEEAQRLDALLVHYSTDYVFDGEASKPYSEEDPANPINAYGRSKWEGEEAIRAVGAPHLIFRTSWLYSTRGKNFLSTVLTKAKSERELKIVNDQTGTPNWNRMIAEITGKVLAALVPQTDRRPPEWRQYSGTYHLSARGQTTWFGFAQSILHHSVPTGPQDCKLTPIVTSEYPSRARRPRYSVLNGDKLQQTFHIRLPDWEPQLAACLRSTTIAGSQSRTAQTTGPPPARLPELTPK